VEALTAFNRHYLDHYWTTGALEGTMRLDKMECRSGFGILLPFTARELIEPLQVELNCNQLFGMNCRGLVGRCILTVNHLQLMHEDVYADCTGRAAALMTLYYSRRRRTSLPVMKMIILISLVKSMWKSLDFQSALMA